MLESASDELPKRWQEKWRTMDSAWTGDKTENTLQEWLEEVYFNGEREEDFTREEVVKVGALIRKLLRFEPSMRAEAEDVLRDPWFGEK
jgi:serine/threonine-protein kinase SRPK3